MLGRDVTPTQIRNTKRIKAARFLFTQLYIGFARDVMWALATKKNWDFFDGELGSYLGPTITQMTFTLPTMFIATKLGVEISGVITPLTNHIPNKIRRITIPVIIALSSWSAIPVWNGAQILGYELGMRAFQNATAANYYAGIHTGIAETVWQNAIIIPFCMRQKPEILDVAFNTLAGAVWQWVYTALADQDELVMAGGLATCVLQATLFMTLLGWFINGYSDFVKRSRETSHNTIEIEVKPSVTTQSIFKRLPKIGTNLLEANRERRLTV